MTERALIYVDANVLISVLLDDGLSETAEEWLAQQTGALAVSDWTRTEIHAVIGLRMRKGELTRAQASAAIAQFGMRAEQHLQVLAFADAATVAAEWLRDPYCSLQTGDALHLAIAHGGGATKLATFDERFAKAAQKLRLHNLKIELIRVAPKRVAQKRAAYVVAPMVVRPKAKAGKKK